MEVDATILITRELRKKSRPTRVHESCLRTWVGACAHPASFCATPLSEVQQSVQEPASPPSPFPPLVRSVVSVLGLLLPVRARTASRPTPCLVLLHTIGGRCSSIKMCVAPTPRSTRPRATAGGTRYSSLRALSRASSGRMASKYEVLQGDRVLATLTRNVLGTRWTVKSGETRTHVDYAESTGQ